MRIWHGLLSAAVSIVISVTMTPPAKAQTLFQKLFGFGGNAPVGQTPVQPRFQIPAHRFHRDKEISPARGHHKSEVEDDIGPPDSGGPYRLMCVRACDGYYFPLRHHARHQNFAGDIKTCRSACGDDARIFYFPEDGGSPDTMMDLTGRKYSETPKAFAYRKTLVQGCTCKPQPWSGEEAARHQSYAAAETNGKTNDAAKREADAVVSKDATPEPVAAAQDKPTPEPAAQSEAAAEKTSAPETYEPVRPRVQKISTRKKPVHLSHERTSHEQIYVTGFRPAQSPVFLPQKKYLWRSDVR